LGFLRRVVVAVVAVAIVLAVFWLYGRWTGAPDFDSYRDDGFAPTAAESNSATGEVGKIGGVGIGDVSGARYYHRDAGKRIDREFGFAKLLHKVRDQLEIEGPYMKVFQRNFNCSITADRGTVEIETTAGRPSPADAAFTGNVVIHLLPQGDSDFAEAWVYMDDVTFISDRSVFSTAGPVRFLSADVEMLGRGLELVYNETLERLEFFRVVKLQSLRLSSGKTGSMSKSTSDKSGRGGRPEDSPAGRVDPNEIAAGDYYRCVLGGNVTIDGPDQFVVAQDRLVISDIFWARSDANAPRDSNSASVGADAIGRDSIPMPAEPNTVVQSPLDVMVTCDRGILLAPVDSRLGSEMVIDSNVPVDASAWPAAAKDKPSFHTGRIDYSVLTDDTVASGLSQLTFFADSNIADPNGRRTPVTITAWRETRFVADSNQVIFDGNCVCVMPSKDPNLGKDYVFQSPRIIVDLLGDSNDLFSAADINAVGPVRLDFATENMADVKAAPMPVSVTARKNATVSAAGNQVVFDGDCVATMLKDDPNILETYILKSPMITMDLPDKTKGSSGGPDFKHVAAHGGLVDMATVRTAKTAAGQLAQGDGANLGGIELKCRRFDFDPNEEVFTATGPGMIQLDNSKIAEPNERKVGMSLRRPCYAFVRNFDNLRYYLKDNKVVADADSQGTLRVDYIPVRKGEYGEHVVATASHVEAFFAKTLAGDNELSTLHATGGITYEDEKNQFVGSELFYNHAESLMTVKGDRTQPCYFNGALVKGIEYDLNTGRVRAELAGPGLMQLKQ